MVGKLLERAGDEIVALLKDNPAFDVGSHTYSHADIVNEDPAALERFSEELVLTSDLIFDYFEERPLGFCAPGWRYKGLQGHPAQLAILWDQGYRYIGSDNSGPPEQWQPSPMTQPYWYAEEGFPELFEVPGTGWHCNYLFNTGGQNDDWTPAPGYPDGTVLEKLPVTVEEGFQVRSREFRYCIKNHLVYSPSMHPWSVYRFDPELKHVDSLIRMARAEAVPVMNCRQLYETYRDTLPTPQRRGS